MKRISSGLGMLGVFLLGMSLVCNATGFAQTTYEIEDDLSVGDSADEGMVSLDFKDADLKDVLKVFSQQSGLNFVADRNIEDKLITLYMSEVSVEDALRTLLDANNLGLEQNPGSNILIVRQKPTLPIQTITRVYKIHYYHGNVTPGHYVLGETKKEDDSNNESSWGKIIRPLLSEYGSVVAYMNLVIVTDVPDRFKLVDQVISEIDKPISECMIEVELIETTANFLENLGVKWNKQMLGFTGPARATPIPFTPFEDINTYGEGKTVGLPASDAHFTYGLMDGRVMNWVLEMLQTDTNTKFLSKPRILCQDREWAEIKITEDKVVSVVTVVTDKETKTYVERMEVGTVLRLVPIINSDEGFVSLLLEPSISRPINSTFSDPSSGTSFIDPQIRSMRTVVMAKSGETVAVGGFITTEDQEVKTKVPWLGDIPLMGAFFRHKNTDRVDKELLIFITPRIVDPADKVEMWIPDSSEQKGKNVATTQAAANLNQSFGVEQETSMQAAKPAQMPKELPFREQEELGSLNLDLTMQSSSLGVVDLVK